MTPPVSETLYTDNNFHFNPVEYPKDEYVQYDEDDRVLSGIVKNLTGFSYFSCVFR